MDNLSMHHLSMDDLWIIHASSMDQPSMDHPFNIHGLSIVHPSMDNPWMIHRLSMDAKFAILLHLSTTAATATFFNI